MAELSFGAETSRRLRELPAGRRGAEFLRLWTRHEARLKCAGEGLTGSSAAVPPHVALVELDVGSGFAAAAAVDGRLRRTLLLEAVWPPPGARDGPLRPPLRLHEGWR